MKITTRINQNIPNFFLTIIVQVCTNRTKHMALHVAPNVANNTQNHGHMQKERLVLELDIKKIICMDT